MPKTRSIGNIQWIGSNKCILRVSAGFDDYGKRIQLSRTIEAKSQTDAEKQLAAFYKDKDKLAQERVTKAPKTLQGLYEEFEKNHMPQLRPNTQAFYKFIWNGYLQEKGKASLKNFTPKMVYGILNDVDAGDRTKNGVYRTLYTLFEKAVGWGYMQNNPCERIDPPKYKAKEKRPYSAEELRQVVAAIEKEDVQIQLIFYLAATLGMRRSEIVALKWSDIDFACSQLSINRAAGTATGVGTYIDDTKTAKSARSLGLTPELITLLKRRKAEQAERRLKLANKWHDEDWIFTQWNGKLVHVDTPTKLWSDFLDANPALPMTNLHSLRHTAATLLILNNVPISTVSGLLGHAQISTTANIYAHVVEDAKKSAVNLMGSIMRGDQPKKIRQKKNM